ncbi:12-oxophytodienoate reductase-like protein [Hondaea fermentalgiana]|uniref:12-oxophytodienoate reductase-like protein n=1 Tax=Hondaea fermentalgiana TaxID=2315210 RepID=A0A2R5GMZ0_9STRA|nr:12-oxophytodienoate reductase-like protein [Hondaea fermentalgiana]|eukprot:GBG31985.1 12-oxophytodienoate reductase-like protein [Hondaea fermentalgiana]
MATKFPHLFKPLELNKGRVVLKNRALMGSMHTGLEEETKNGSLEAMAEFYGARARGGVGLLVTGGISPNNAGRVTYMAAKMSTPSDRDKHKAVTEAVHAEDGRIAMQILHSGRYAYHHWAVGPSPLKSPISMVTPKALSSSDVEDTIDDFVRSAELAGEAGYDGVEVMGSEGYLINQFITAEANKRSDKWGGAYENRIRFPIEIVRRIREALGPDFIVIYRLSMLDLVQGGSTWEEIELLAREIEAAGASIINTGIGWHQARIPTIATAVPRGGFAWVTKNLMGKVDIPVCTTNRINMPSTAEDILREGYADMVSMARPFLADPNLIEKARQGDEAGINTCIGCNQACLDHAFQGKRASCLVNPFAGYETELKLAPISDDLRKSSKVAVVGAGPAGLACAVSCAERGFETTLFEKDADIGGQFNMAKRIPGKEEFFETLRYFSTQIHRKGVDLQLNRAVSIEDLDAAGYTHVVLATGVAPRQVSFPGSDHSKVVSYVDVLCGKVKVGKRVAIVGAGGIGFDVAEFLSDPEGKGLTEKGPDPGLAKPSALEAFAHEWKIDLSNSTRGGLAPSDEAESDQTHSPREIFLLQRGKHKVGANLGKTTGWIHRTSLRHRGVNMLRNVKYVKVDDDGFHIQVKGKDQVLDVDHVVICAGQVAQRALWDKAQAKTSGDTKYFLIGGSQEASELDAKRAIDQGTRLAAVIETARTGDVFNQPVPLFVKIFEKVQSFIKA